MEKFNIRLIYILEYLQRFNLDIRYKSGAANKIFDILFKLASTNYILENDEKILEALNVDYYLFTVV